MPTAPYTPQSKRELLRVQARVFLFAPGPFGQPSNTLPGEETTLESSFDELRRGVDHIYRKPHHDAARQRMHELLNQSYDAFKAGQAVEGRRLCVEFERLMNTNRP